MRLALSIFGSGEQVENVLNRNRVGRSEKGKWVGFFFSLFLSLFFSFSFICTVDKPLWMFPFTHLHLKKHLMRPTSVTYGWFMLLLLRICIHLWAPKYRIRNIFLDPNCNIQKHHFLLNAPFNLVIIARRIQTKFRSPSSQSAITNFDSERSSVQ